VSFDASISVTSFNELSGSVFSWLEEYCKPQVTCQLLSNVTLAVEDKLSSTDNQAGLISGILYCEVSYRRYR